MKAADFREARESALSDWNAPTGENDNSLTLANVFWPALAQPPE